MSGQRCHPFEVVSRVFAERMRGGEPSDQLRATLVSQDIDWDAVVGYASSQFALPAFAAALRDLGLIQAVDQDLAAFLRAVHAANLERNSEIRDELVAAARALNRAGMEPVLLKGAIRLVERLFPDDGWRMLRDLDLLVPEARWSDAFEALAEIGYTLIRQSYQEAVLERDGGLVIIEVHKELFPSSRQARLLRGLEVLKESRLIAFDRASLRVPSIGHQVAHLIGHGQIGHCNYAYGRIALCDRVEAAALVHWGGEHIDWKAVHERFAAAGYRRPLLAFLLSLRDGGLCNVPLHGGTDLLTTLQQRRIALQARSTTMAGIGFWAGRAAAKLGSQFTQRDAGRLRAVRNVNRLICERGAARQAARSFVEGAPRRW